MSELLPVLVLGAFVAVFGIAIVVLAAILGRPKHKQSAIKLEAYECGVPGDATGAETKIPVKFYLTAILFILFDIEIIFMYPWAIAFNDFITSGLGLYALSAMGIFVLIFIFGLFWEVKSRALEWE